ncbi:DMT family transporter [Micromonospora zhanjiangensis]|uniref:DMT family transporter n=1 Tax=Micromonospora zhanjiangensis TaxID=1522057 RepID=A0ABV8KR53_9ACTN
MSLLAVVLGLASATVFALGSTLEQHAAKREPATRTFDPRLLFRLLHRPMWLFGWIPDVAATVLQAMALSFGALALVEPLLLAGVFIAIPLEAALERRRPHRRDLLVVALGVAGLAAFLIAANPRAGVDQPSPLAWTGVGLVIGALFAICLIGAWRVREASRGVLLGIATGLLYGAAAALLKTLTAEFTADPVGVLNDWQLYVLVVVGIGGVVLNQNAFQGGPIAASLSVIALVDPLVGVLVGVTAFHERLSLEPARVVIQVAAAVVMTVGIVLAGTTRSR